MHSNYTTPPSSGSSTYRHRVLRSFLMLLAPATLALAGLVASLYFLRLQTDYQNASARTSTMVAAQKIQIESTIEDIAADLELVTALHTLRNTIENGSERNKEILASELLSFARIKRIYNQVRYCDKTGMEIVRINYNNGTPSIVPTDLLQPKGDRYYFRDTIGLAPHNLYISPLDLNVENGKIETPFKPVIRFSMSIHDRMGEAQGIVILNYLAANLLSIIGNYDDTSPYEQETILLNSDGYWLKAMDPIDEWGFMLEERKNRSFSARHPEIWQQIQQTPQGVLETQDGLWVFTTLRPMSNNALPIHTVEANYHWLLISHIPSHTIEAEAQYMLRRILIIACLLIASIALIAWRLAVAKTERQQALDDLKSAKMGLEISVEERTAELSTTNSALQREIAEHEKAEAEKRTIQGMLLQAQKMEAIGTLAGGIAHDFNNLLTIILGYTELAALSSKDNPKVREMLQTALDAGGHARDLVQQILTFSRQQAPKNEELSIAPIVREALKFIRSSLPSTIEMVQHIDDQCGSIYSNTTNVHQLIMNLCTNAAHAMEKGGVLTVTLKSVRGEEAAAKLQVQECILLQISDNGAGMSQEVKARIFEPYFTTKDPGKGTGLGMAVVHGIIKNGRGLIEIDSAPGEGTEFRLYFPALSTMQSTVTHRSQGAVSDSGNILFIDDEEHLATLGQYILQNAGYSVTYYTDPLEAWADIEQNPQHFAAVVTDHTMPGMTGIQFSEKLRTLHLDLPILLCTGYRELEIDQHIHEGLIDDQLPKPYTMFQLQEAVYNLLHKSKTDPKHAAPHSVT